MSRWNYIPSHEQRARTSNIRLSCRCREIEYKLMTGVGKSGALISQPSSTVARCELEVKSGCGGSEDLSHMGEVRSEETGEERRTNRAMSSMSSLSLIEVVGERKSRRIDRRRMKMMRCPQPVMAEEMRVNNKRRMGRKRDGSIDQRRKSYERQR